MEENPEENTGKHKSTSFGSSAYNDSVKKPKVSKVNSSVRRSSKDYNKTIFNMNVMKKHKDEISSCGIDNHADTCCLGSNFRVTFKTYNVCYVSPFLE